MMQGCYIGQETLSKLINLDAVKQQLWGLDVSSPVSGGDEISGMSLEMMNSTLCPVLWHFSLGTMQSIQKRMAHSCT